MRPGVRALLFFMAFVGLLTGAGAWVGPLNAARVQNQLVAAEIPDSAQPGMMLGPLMAVGRALVVDYLWMRATKLKEDGRYFDAYQLAETICRLQPRFPSVWAFNAWNMAYNISVTLRTPEERWRWVKNGFEMLRDQGIRHNPRCVQMYRELAWIFFHKVGDYVDEMHMYYKLQFALMMEDVLGPGPTHDWQAFAAAPRTWEELVSDPKIASVARTFDAIGEDASRPGVYLGLLNREKPSRDLQALLADPASADARQRIEIFWRCKRLREELKLDPQRIIDLCDAYGPIDFRLAEAHALYWATLGTEIGSDRRVALDIDRLNTDRVELFCLQNFFRRGRLIMSPQAKQGEYPMLLPDIRFADKLRQALLSISKKYPQRPGEGPVSSNFQTLLTNFMREACLKYNEAGDLKKSREYFDWLVENYPVDDYKNGYEAFITREWITGQEFVQLRDALWRIQTVIARGVLLIGYGEDEQGAASISFARKLYAEYVRSQNNKRSLPPPFETLYEMIVHQVGERMRPETYERVLKKTGFKRPATPPSAASQPAP